MNLTTSLEYYVILGSKLIFISGITIFYIYKVHVILQYIQYI